MPPADALVDARMPNRHTPAAVWLQVQRIGKYKSAGDQLLRRDMSEPQREQLTALLDDIYATFVADVAQVRVWPVLCSAGPCSLARVSIVR